MHRPSHAPLLCTFAMLALSGFAQATAKEFQQVATFPTGKTPIAVALADFNTVSASARLQS